MSTKHFPCPQCGAQVQYHGEAGSLKCVNCTHAIIIPRSPDEIERLDFGTYEQRARQEYRREVGTVVLCRTCRTSFLAHLDQPRKACPVCGDGSILVGEPESQFPSKEIVPFFIDRQDASEIYAEWLGKQFLAPGNLRRRRKDEHALHEVFVPYWVFDVATTTYYMGSRGEDVKREEKFVADASGTKEIRTRPVVDTDWVASNGVVWQSFDRVLVPAAAATFRFPGDSVMHWNIDAAMPYHEEHTRGCCSIRSDIGIREAFAEARRDMELQIDVTIRSDIGGDRQRIGNRNTQYDKIKFEMIQLPVWMASYRHRDKSYMFAVNGQTGESYGEAPLSMRKVVLGTAALVLAVVGSSWLGMQWTQGGR